MGCIAGVGMIIAPLVQVTWLLRFLVAGYVALGLTLLLPQELLMIEHMHMSVFAFFVIILATVGKMRFFGTPTWIVGRFAPQIFGLSVTTVYFFASVICYFLPLEVFMGIITDEVHGLLREYVFYVALIPMIFCYLFAKK